MPGEPVRKSPPSKASAGAPPMPFRIRVGRFAAVPCPTDRPAPDLSAQAATAPPVCPPSESPSATPSPSRSAPSSQSASAGN